MANNPTPEHKSAFITDDPGSGQGDHSSSVYPFLDDADSQKLQAEVGRQEQIDSSKRRPVRRKRQPAAPVAGEKDADSNGPEIYFLGFLVVVLFALVCIIVYLFVFDLPRLQEIVNGIASLFGQ